MSTITTNAIAAYNKAAGIAGTPGVGGDDSSVGSGDFASLVQDALSKAIDGGKQAEMKSAQNIAVPACPRRSPSGCR